MEMNSLTVLKALLIGLEVEFDDLKYCMSEDNQLCWVGQVYHGGECIDPYRLHVADISLNEFIKMCERLPADYLKDLKVDLAFNAYKQDTRKTRV